MKKIYFFLFFIFITYSTFAQTFSGAIGPIADDGSTNDYNLPINGFQYANLNTSFGIQQVCLNITHTWDSDLNVFLVSPSGTMVNLFSGIGGDGDNFTNTCLNQSAPASINILTH